MTSASLGYTGGVATLEEQNAILARQVAYFASDDHIRDEVAPWRDASPEERLAMAAQMSEENRAMLDRLPMETVERLWKLRELPADTVAILEKLRKSTR